MSSKDEMLRDLMRLAQCGDKRSYAILLRECDTWLQRYFARKVPMVAIDDLVQETLLSVHRKRATYDPERPFLPWLAAIARYRWIDHLRKVYRLAETQLDEAREAALHSEESDSHISLESLLIRLPDKQAEVIRLVKISGFSIAEAASRTGQSEALVKVNIHRGIRKMGSIIEDA